MLYYVVEICFVEEKWSVLISNEKRVHVLRGPADSTLRDDKLCGQGLLFIQTF